MQRRAGEFFCHCPFLIDAAVDKLRRYAGFVPAVLSVCFTIACGISIARVARVPLRQSIPTVSETLPQSRIFLLLRYTLIAAAAYLLLVEQEFSLPPIGAMLLVAAAFASNVGLTLLNARVTRSPYFGACIIVGDTLWITAALLQSGRFSADFFYLYFFVLLLAAIGENLGLIAIGAVVVCGAYMYLLGVTGAHWSFWHSPSLIRIPFLFTTAAFYGYLVDQTRRERRKADEAERIKSEFLGTISHELRTPLNVILGYVDLLLDRTFGPLPANQESILRKVRQAGGMLYEFIGRLLDLSRVLNRIHSGQERVVCSDVDVASLFEALRVEFPENPTTRLAWHAPAGLPLLYTDHEKLQSVLRNLVENAVKYTPRGSVNVAAACVAEGDAIEIRIADTGLGIPPQELPHIFDAFRRGASDPSQPAVAGVGLGLYIVRKFVDLLEGQIRVDSQVGVGSTFRVQLPRRVRSTAKHAPAIAARSDLPPLAHDNAPFSIRPEA